jgi:hypothetical protein
MTAAVWPSTLPAAPELAGYGEGMGKQVLRTEMDAGPAKLRRRFTAAPRPYTMPMTLSGAQLEALVDFWSDDCQGGALAFTMRHPRDAEETILCRFTEEPKWTALGGGVFRVALELEILP